MERKAAVEGMQTARREGAGRAGFWETGIVPSAIPLDKLRAVRYGGRSRGASAAVLCTPP